MVFSVVKVSRFWVDISVVKKRQFWKLLVWLREVALGGY